MQTESLHLTDKQINTLHTQRKKKKTKNKKRKKDFNAKKRKTEAVNRAASLNRIFYIKKIQQQHQQPAEHKLSCTLYAYFNQ